MPEAVAAPIVELVGGKLCGTRLHCSSDLDILFVRQVPLHTGHIDTEAFDQPFIGCEPYFREGTDTSGSTVTYTSWINAAFRARHRP